ncbi:MAG TPA: hypothetical protein VNQ32_01630 [Steroidobacteraceae bacterium]|nr:hypothetical protein [Steroidobacteraceae bacterium]
MKYLFSGWALPALLVAAGAAHADPAKLPTSTRYDVEYPGIAYSDAARENRVWRMQQKLASGELKLEWEPGTGYLRSLLKALEIDMDSQVLVFSRTSLQIEHISPATPRAVYFNDDTYVGFVQNSPLIELTAIDASKGAVFYGFENRQELAPEISREGGRCLTCHDTYSMSGGGVPRVMVLSSPVDDPSDTRTVTSGQDVDDSTPFSARWGGWYVTGNTGKRTHLGNLPLREGRHGEKLRELRGSSNHNIDELKAYLDTSHYLSGKSDVVALTVLEHQTRLQNLVTRVNYKIRTILEREAKGGAPAASGPIRSWEDISPNDHTRLRQIMEPLVRALFLHDAAPFEDRMASSSGFAERFSKLGPRDSRGRSLRELDLQKRLFRYPLSFEIYSPQFDALPEYAREYINGRIVEVLQGRDTTGISEKLTAEDRKAISEILIDTKPALAAALRASR